jgi:hypothetical protein
LEKLQRESSDFIEKSKRQAAETLKLMLPSVQRKLNDERQRKGN